MPSSLRLSPELVLLGIAVLVILLVVLMLVVLWRTRNKQDAQPPEGAAPEHQEKDAAESDGGQSSAKRRISNAPAEIALRWSVSSAIRFLRRNSTGRDFRYRAPWVMVVGAANSGKTTLLEHSGISLSLREGATDFGVSHGIGWRFFDGGVLLDVPGDFFLHAGRPGSDERSWKSLLRNLQRYRPGRPLDGIVLTLPCTELIGEKAITPAQIGQRAAQIVDKLWQLEKWLGLCLPIYVVVTKCDTISGFKGLARQLPSAYHRQMFGWSNPNNLQAAFDSGWIDQGFDELLQSLNILQSETLVEREDIDDRDGVFLLSARLQELRRPLRIYLGQIFKQPAYRESHQLRGFYFVGDGADPQDLPEPVRAMAAAASYSGSATHELVTGEVLGISPVAPPVAPMETPTHSPVFVTDLFENKIFKEDGLARPPAKLYLSKDRAVLGFQALALIVGIVLALGVWIQYRRMDETRRATVPVLDNVVSQLKQLNQLAPEHHSHIEGDTAYNLIHLMQSLTGSRYRTVFLPTSYISPLDDRVKQAMVPAFEKLVYSAFRSELLDHRHDLLEEPIPGEAVPDGARGDGGESTSSIISLKPLQEVSAYQRLRDYTSSLLALEANIARYNELATHGKGDPQSLIALESYLHGHELPAEFDYASNPYFRAALKQAAGEMIETDDQDRRLATARMEKLVAVLFTQWLANNQIVDYLDGLRDNIDALDKQQLESYADLNDLKNSLVQAQTVLGSADLAWITSEKFELPDALKQVTTVPIQQSGYLSPKPRLEIFVQVSGARAFDTLKRKLDEEGTALTGDLLDLSNGQVKLSPDADQLRMSLVDLLNLPYVQRDAVGKIHTGIAPGEQLIWNKDPLQEAAGLKDSYDRFVAEGLQKVSPMLKSTLQLVALNRLQANMQALIGKAELVQAPAEDAQQSLLAEVQGFQDASPTLTRLLDQFHQLGLYPGEQALSQLTTTQAGSLLRQVDQFFGAQSLYTPVGGAFDRWNGQNTPARGGFDVHNPDEMNQYLQFQRQDIQQYAAEAAPLESFLEFRLPAGRREPEGLVGKWKKIIADLQKYDAKMPGSSLAGLEDFVSVEMDKVTPENCQSSVLAASASPGGDYFVQRREFLRRALATRCYYLSQQNAIRQYARIADLFNQRIAGKFPFSPAPSEQLPSEADPQDVAELYRLLDIYSKSIHGGLQNGNFGGAHVQVLGFLNQMEALRPLFASLFTGEPSALPMFDFVPVFRVNQGREIKGNHIIDWTLQVGTDTFRYREPERVGRWSFGQPVKLVLRWAKDSPDQPSPVKGAVDARATSSRSVSYEFRDSWALLNMVVRHEAAPTDFDRMVDPEPQTLAFTVAGTEQDPEAKVFIRVKLRPPGKPENLRLRGFPAEAPSLSDDQMRTAEGGSQ